jgi:adenosylcobinamide amidohydrolase
VLGGGIGDRRWVVNVQVPSDYERTDPLQHLVELADAAGCVGPGIGFLTAARVDRFTTGSDECVEAYATVGLQLPIWSAAPKAHGRPCPGTINIVVLAPVALSDAALVNAATTATEAKVQALVEHDVAGTGTASDAICVVAPAEGAPEEFCGPRSRVGASLARAVHRAVSDGVTRWRSAAEEIS